MCKQNRPDTRASRTKGQKLQVQLFDGYHNPHYHICYRYELTTHSYITNSDGKTMRSNSELKITWRDQLLFQHMIKKVFTIFVKCVFEGNL